MFNLLNLRARHVVICASVIPACALHNNERVKGVHAEGGRFASNFIADAAELASPSVVNIQCKSHAGFLGAIGLSTGSGFIINKSGLIVTNAHVVARAAPNEKLIIRLWKSAQDRTGTVHSLDKESDIAVIQLDMKGEEEELPVARIGSSSTLRAGEFVCALGSPLLLQSTVTAGIISSTARHSSELGLGRSLSEYIQTDCSINQGNSGGPLVNMDGEVIGINVMKAAADGISFSIPIDTAMSVVSQLLRNGKVSRPKVGMRIVNFIENKEDGGGKSSSRKDSILSSGIGVNILVVEVETNSPASRAGLHNGDIITAIQGKPVHGVRELLEIIAYSKLVQLELSVTRPNGHHEQLYLKLERD